MSACYILSVLHAVAQLSLMTTLCGSYYYNQFWNHKGSEKLDN